MGKSTKLRILGFAAVLTVTGVICWQLLPTAGAQEQRKLSADDSSIEGRGNRVTVSNTDEILLNSGPINVKHEKQRNHVGDKAASAPDKFDGKRLHLVRFNGPIKNAWLGLLKSSDIATVDYIPHYTYLVWADSAGIQRMRAESRNLASPVEWEGEYKSEHRIMPSVFADSKYEQLGLRTERFEIQLYRDKPTNSQTLDLVESLRTSDVIGKQEIRHYVNFVVGLDADGLKKLAERPDVISIHPYFEPTKFDERQNLILRGNLSGSEPTPGDYLSYLLGRGFSQAQFDASNFSVDVTDSGIGNADPANENQFLLRRLGDPAGSSRVVYSRLEGTPNTGSSLAGCDGHGNINATIIGGYVPSGGIYAAAPHADASGYRYGLGVAPFVKVGSSVIFDPDSFTSPNVSNLQARAYNDGARISANSWGADTLGAYTSSSQAYDFLVRDAQQTGSVHPTVGNQEMVIVFAGGNDGPGVGTIGSPGSAKNTITVGASENVHPFGGPDRCGFPDTDANSANDIIGFSSRGPTSDGRIKPDIVLPGTHITGGAAQNVLSNPVSGTGTALTCFTSNATGVCGGVGSAFFPAAQQWYTASSGTSHSTPAIAGLAALIRQHFINNAALGGSAGNGTAPSPAMTKALIMNTASFMNGVSANDDLPSGNQGMGRANLENFFDVFAQDNILRDQRAEDTFTDSGQERIFSGTVVDDSKPFRVTLAYSDAPGSTSGNAFVNDLDLEVVVGGVSYKGNVFSKGESVGGGSADTRNNVESVFIPAGISGTFLIRVKGTNIAGDGLPGNGDSSDQDFSLVVWNGESSPVAVISGGSTTFTAESCELNGAIDPAETVTINFDLSNVGLAATSNVVATLLPTGGVSAPSGPQNYGALTAGGGPVTRPFTFTATTDCGENLQATFQLQDGATDLGHVTFDFRTGALAPPTAASGTSGNISTAILDNTTVEIPIPVSTDGVLSDLDVKVRLNHTFDGDLTLAIRSPAGTTVPLAAGRGGSGDNFGSGSNDCTGTFTVFDDGAATAISGGTAPFAGSFRPEALLSALNGESIEGTWHLIVSDGAGGDTGTAGCVQLEIQRQRSVCCGITGSPEPTSGGAPVFVSESFIPANSVPDPGETITFNIPILNAGAGATSNLVATLQNSGGITPVTTSQSYGAIAPLATVSRAFTFIANGPCGGEVTATFDLQDGATNFGTITHTFTLGVPSSSSQSFSNSGAITISSAAVNPASPYPSTINVSGLPTTITNVSLTLNGYSHSYPADVDILLVSPTGRKFIVMSDAGDTFGSIISTPQNWTFEDSAPATLPQTWASPPAGPFKPTNYSLASDPFAAPAPASPYLSPAPSGAETFASAFGGATGGNPNGTWSLYIMDDFADDGGSIANGWSLTFTTASATCSSTPGPTEPERAVRADFDGDGSTDLSIFRPSTGSWWVNRSTDGIGVRNWGVNGDVPFSADFSGDKDADFGIFRPQADPVEMDFWLLNTPSFNYEAITWGIPGDIPFGGDYDGDGDADLAVYRPSTNTFFLYLFGPPRSVRVFSFGLPGDIPLAGDFNGNGTTDLAVYRPSNGRWYYAEPTGNPGANVSVVPWGLSTDIPVPADYDGDGADDIAVFRPSNGTWYIRNSETGTISYIGWGLSTDIPVPGDYDGDGNYDVAIYRNGTWWIRGSQVGTRVAQWGLAGDIPIPATYIDPIP